MSDDGAFSSSSTATADEVVSHVLRDLFLYDDATVDRLTRVRRIRRLRSVLDVDPRALEESGDIEAAEASQWLLFQKLVEVRRWSNAEVLAFTPDDWDALDARAVERAHASRADGLNDDDDDDDVVDVFVTVVRAVLEENFDQWGRMDPYAVVEYRAGPGRPSARVARTRTDRGAHFTPAWNYVCRSLLYAPRRSDDDDGASVVVTVHEEDIIGADDLCGSCEIPLRELLARTETSDDDDRCCALPLLRKKKKRTGTVYLRATAIRASVASSSSSSLDDRSTTTTVAAGPSCFDESAMEPIGVSGGKSAFYSLKLLDDRPNNDGRSPHHYIGKVVQDKEDNEVDFYERVRRLKVDTDQADTVFHGLLDFMFEYNGVVDLNNTVTNSNNNKNSNNNNNNNNNNKSFLRLLAVRNLRDGHRRHRMLDIKMGSRTAKAGWCRKTWLKASAQRKLVDEQTNSNVEGYRVEGFDGAPPFIDPADAVIDGHVLQLVPRYSSSPEKLEKKLFKRYLQRLNARVFLGAFVDFHQDDFDHDDDDDDRLYPEEYAEIVLDSVVRSLLRLSVVCHKILVPQKWIGTSVALSFDAGRLPRRSESRRSVRRSVALHLFDWGRAELNDLESNRALDPAAHADRVKCWKDYVAAVDRLSWEAARLLHDRWPRPSRDGPPHGDWDLVQVSILDCDSKKEDDFLGEVVLPPLTPGEGFASQRLPVSLGKGRAGGALVCSCAWTDHPPSSRYRGAWQLLLVKGEDLRNADLKACSDPYCDVTVSSTRRGVSYHLFTSVRENTLSPVWNETFEILSTRTTPPANEHEHDDDDDDDDWAFRPVFGDDEDLDALFADDNAEEGFGEWVRRVERAEIPNV